MRITNTLLESEFRKAASRASDGSLPNGVLAVSSVGDSFECFAGADSSGRWILAITVEPHSAHVPAIKLRELEADFGARYVLDLGGKHVTRDVCIVTCSASNSSVEMLFATFSSALISSLPSLPSIQEIAREINNWIKLFWKLQSPSRTDIVGLIGELVLLEQTPSISDWLHAWHKSATDNVDFSFNTPRLGIEVKATTGRERIHTISMSQAINPSNEKRYVASILVELRESGVCVKDFVESISNQLPTGQDQRLFWESIIDICGVNLNSYLEERFMLELSRESIEFYPTDSIPTPKVDFPLPPGVSVLKFQSNFSYATAVDPQVIFGKISSFNSRYLTD